LPAIREREQQFLCPIFSLGMPRDLRAPQCEVARQLVAQRLRQIRHCIEIGGTPRKQPAPHLPHTVRTLAAFRAPRTKLLINCI
jgi:hypothetical protein